MPFRFAVDLGTSNTVAVVDRGDGNPRPLLFDGNPLLPSAVFADPSGRLFVGRDAERHMMTDASRFEPNPKGRIDEGVILLGDRELPVAEVLAAVLRRAAAEAEQTGVPVAGATVLTCPVDWGNARRGVLLEAAGRAGLGRVVLLDEPVSAATYCVRVLGHRLPPGRCAVVFDLGGGTLDVTVVEAGLPALRVLATGGLDDLGGTDVDAALVGHLGQHVSAADERLWRRLAAPATAAEFRDRRTFWSEVRAAKEMLSRASSAPIHVPGSDRATHLTRDELDRIAGPLIDRAVDETRRVLQRSGVPPARLDAIVLVGGSSRLPLVASRLHARFGLAPVVPEQPELPVAFGALLLANGDAQPPPERTGTGIHPVSAQPVSAYPVSAAPTSAYPVSAYPVSAYPVSAAPVSAAPTSAQPAVPPRPPRPSVIIGPGVTLQGNVAVYGDADLMPDYDPAPRPAAEEPEPEPAPVPRRARPRRGILRRLRFVALPLVPWVLIMTLTPWGRGLFADGRAKVAALVGAGSSPSAAGSPAAGSPLASPSASRSSAAAAPTVQLSPSSGKAGVTVRMTVRGFAPGEKIDVRSGSPPVTVTTLTADDGGGTVQSGVLAPAGTKPGTVMNVQLIGRTNHKSAQASYRVVG